MRPGPPTSRRPAGLLGLPGLPGLLLASALVLATPAQADWQFRPLHDAERRALQAWLQTQAGTEGLDLGHLEAAARRRLAADGHPASGWQLEGQAWSDGEALAVAPPLCRARHQSWVRQAGSLAWQAGPTHEALWSPEARGCRERPEQVVELAAGARTPAPEELAQAVAGQQAWLQAARGLIGGNADCRRLAFCPMSLARVQGGHADGAPALDLSYTLAAPDRADACLPALQLQLRQTRGWTPWAVNCKPVAF